MLYFPGLLQPDPLLHGQPPLAYASAGDKDSKAGLAESCEGSLDPGEQKVLFYPFKHLWWILGFDSKHYFTPPTVLLGLLLCPGSGVHF